MNNKKVEDLVAECRQKLIQAGNSGNKELAKAYQETLSSLLKLRSSSAIRKEEEEKGLI